MNPIRSRMKGRMDNQTLEMLRPWLEAVKNRDVESAVHCYAKEAVLLGTFSKSSRKGLEKIQDYFNNFLKKEALTCEIKECFSFLGDQKSTLCGRYTFMAQTEKNATVMEIPARFTFVFELNSEKEWKIIHHHSSVLPES